jgi:hypothetical protein
MNVVVNRLKWQGSDLNPEGENDLIPEEKNAGSNDGFQKGNLHEKDYKIHVWCIRWTIGQ